MCKFFISHIISRILSIMSIMKMKTNDKENQNAVLELISRLDPDGRLLVLLNPSRTCD